ncbi:MAG TPA: hypothetical protein VGP92_05445, partial [Acidimicrobiia bacterium]|nr:hypothetical protein [Acidimicrobiia bacterium]
ERATARIVTKAGAKLQAVGADGTRFSLAIPKGALLSPLAIRITPVRRVVGLPTGTELAFALDLQPHGLVFSRAAWLTVQTKVAQDVKSGLAIDDAKVASLQPIGHNAHGYVIPVAHFSGTGGVRLPGGFGEWPNMQPGGASAGSLQNNAIGAGGPINLPPTFTPPEPPATTPPPGGLGGDSAGDNGANTAPGEASNGGDPTLAGDISGYVQQQAEQQLNGNEGSDDGARAALVGRIVNVIDVLAKECVAGNPAKIVDIMRWEARGMMLGMDDDEAQAARQDKIIQACTRFELVLTGKFFFDAPPVFHIGDAISLSVPLEFTGAAHEGEADTPIKPTGYDRGGELLDVFAQGIGAAAGINVPNDQTKNTYVHCTVAAGHIHVAALATNMYKDNGPVIALTFNTTRQSAVTCDGGVGTFEIPPFVTMTDELRGLGVAEATASGFLLKTFNRGSGNPYATHEIHRQLAQAAGSVSVDWTFKVNFAPGKLPPPTPSGSGPSAG